MVVPSGITSTAWPSVRDKCLELGISFQVWQHGAGKIILAKRADGKYAATIGGTVISIPRQVGKTFLVGAIVFALCLIHPGLTVIWTAHRLRTAGETFASMQGMAKRKKIKPYIARIVLGSGDEEIRFLNGSRILFGARERGFGRGFDEVDVLIFDEGQILTENAIDDMVPAMNQSRQPAGGLLLFMGTPPKPTDPGEVFGRKRDEALSGDDQDTSYIEFSADPNAKVDDWNQVAKANPSFPDFTPREAILRMRKNLSPESYMREGLGIWDAKRHLKVIPDSTWLDLIVSDVPDDPPGAFGLDMSHDRIVSIGVCVPGEKADHVELAALDRVTDSAGVVAWLVERAGRRTPVVVDAQSPAASMIPDLKAKHVKVIVTSASDMAKACGGFYDAALEGRLSHFDQQQLNDAVAGVKKRRIGDAGGFGWDRKDLEIDISPLVAVTLARFGVAASPRKRTNRAIFA